MKKTTLFALLSILGSALMLLSSATYAATDNELETLFNGLLEDLAGEGDDELTNVFNEEDTQTHNTKQSLENTNDPMLTTSNYNATSSTEKFYRSIIRAVQISNVKQEICKMGYNNMEAHFTDIDTSTNEGRAIEKMAQYCIVHGYNNDGKTFGLNQYLTKGQAYKIFVRMLVVDHATYNNKEAHWALPFYAAGRPLGLWNEVHEPGQLDDPIMLDDFVHIVQNITDALDRIQNKSKKDVDYNQLQGRLIKRGVAAELIAHILERMYE